jgi:hypothetical protein
VIFSHHQRKEITQTIHKEIILITQEQVFRNLICQINKSQV